MNDDIEAMINYCSCDREWEDVLANIDALEPHYLTSADPELLRHHKHLKESAGLTKLSDADLHDLVRMSTGHILCAAVRMAIARDRMAKQRIRVLFPPAGMEVSVGFVTPAQREELRLTFTPDRLIAEYDSRYSVGFSYGTIMTLKPQDLG